MIIDVLASAGAGLAVSIFAFALVVLSATALAGRQGAPRNPRRPVVFRGPKAQRLEGVLFRLYLDSRKN